MAVETALRCLDRALFSEVEVMSMPCVQLARLNARRRKTPVARRAALGLCLLAFLVGGCDFLLPLVLMEHKEKVPAEFDKLSGKRTAIVVWSPQETLFDYPHVRMELALHIADRIWSNIKDAEIVDGRKIEDHIQRTLSAAADPENIGKEFGCDYVVYLELLDFQMRDPDAPDFLRAHIGASVTVYDLKSGSDEPRRYDLADVDTVYPENNPLLFNDTNAVIVRKQAYEMFAEEIANKFYAHNVDM